MHMSAQYQALIVDDHPVIGHALEMMLEHEKIQVVGKAVEGVEVLQLARTLDPDIIILDIALPLLNGLEVIRRIKLMGLRAKILVFTSQNIESFARRCRQAGASGFISKAGNYNNLIIAINAIRTGYSFFPDDRVRSNGKSKEKGNDEALKLASLSEREMMVLLYLAKGHTNKQIGDAMTLSNKTISTYKTRLLFKLEINNLVDLFALAQRNNLIE